jgi:hypothetical protein
MIATKYAIGRTVWSAGTRSGSIVIKCPDCLGKGVWRCSLPNGTEMNIPCPACGRGWAFKQWTHLPDVRQLTIGTVRIDTGKPEPVEYMCEETGIGSGQIHAESKLYDTEDEAHAAAERLAVERNKDAAESFIRDLTARRKSNRPGSLVAYLRRQITDRKNEITRIEHEITRIEQHLDSLQHPKEG